MQAGQHAWLPFHDERLPHAGHRFDLVEIRADGFAREHRAFLEHGPQHAGKREIDAVDRLAGDDAGLSTPRIGLPMIL